MTVGFKFQVSGFRFQLLKLTAHCSLLTAASLLLLAAACRKEPPPPAAADVQAAATAEVAAAAPAAEKVAEPTFFTPFARVDETMPAALEIPRDGADLPLVVIIEAGSYECEYTRKAEPVIAAVLAELPEVARFYLHNPLPGHKQGYLLALAATAAQKQGRFREFHRLLLAGPADLDEDRLLAYARKVGLDVPMFLRDMKRPEVKEYVEKSRTLTAALGLTGTPVFIINGKVVMGLIEEQKLRSLLKKELAAAAGLRRKGAGIAGVHRTLAEAYPPYLTVMEKGVKWGETRQVDVLQDPGTRYRVSDTGWPTLGPPEALVTVVEFVDLYCPFSAKAWEQANALQRKYPEKVRFVFKLNPTSLSRRAVDRPFADPALFAGGPSLEEVKLEAVQVMAVGTPVLFVNGLRRAGFVETEELEKLIEIELALALSLAAKGLEQEQVYEFLTGHGHIVPMLDAVQRRVDGDASLRFGAAKGAPEVVVFWDYGSPFARNLWPHLERLLKRVDGRLTIYLKLLPGEGDTLTARGAVCAGAAGRVAQGHARLLELGRSPISEEAILAVLGTAGLSPQDSATCLAGAGADRLLAAHQSLAHSLGVRKAPAVFINGHRVKTPTGLDFYTLYAAVMQLPPRPQ